jgi:hypothetical protein
VAIRNNFKREKTHGYVAEIASLVSNDLTSVVWIGRTANAEASGTQR